MSINQDKLKEFMKAGWSYHDCGPKTHWEEKVAVNEPLNITWDGNTEGLVSVDDTLYKVSDLVLTDEQIQSGTLTFDGKQYLISEMFGVIGDVAVAGELAWFVRKPNASLGNMVFPDCGIYFVRVSEALYVSSLTTTEPVEHTKTVVHKLDKKYLPDDIGGSGSGAVDLLINVNAKSYSCDIPISELLNKLTEEGWNAVNIKLDNDTDYPIIPIGLMKTQYSVGAKYMEFGQQSDGSSSYMQLCIVVVSSNGSVNITKSFKFTGTVS